MAWAWKATCRLAASLAGLFQLRRAASNASLNLLERPCSLADLDLPHAPNDQHPVNHLQTSPLRAAALRLVTLALVLVASSALADSAAFSLNFKGSFRAGGDVSLIRVVG